MLKVASHFIYLSLGINPPSQYFRWISEKIFLRRKESFGLTFSMRFGTHTTLPLKLFNILLGCCLVVNTSGINGVRPNSSAKPNLVGSTSISGNVVPCGAEKFLVVCIVHW